MKTVLYFHDPEAATLTEILLTIAELAPDVNLPKPIIEDAARGHKDSVERVGWELHRIADHRNWHYSPLKLRNGRWVAAIREYENSELIREHESDPHELLLRSNAQVYLHALEQQVRRGE